MYHKKKWVTSNNFFKPKKNAVSGLSSFVSKYTIQEKRPSDIYCGQGITIEQYFVEMEQRLAASNANHVLNGKRCISTAAPATRQHYINRGISRDTKEDSKVPHEYPLGPVQISKEAHSAYNNKLLKPLRPGKDPKNELTEVDKIRLDQQSYQQRPDSRYNKGSICLSLDGVYKGTRPGALTSWGKERREVMGKLAKVTTDTSHQNPAAGGIMKVYGQF